MYIYLRRKPAIGRRGVILLRVSAFFVRAKCWCLLHTYYFDRMPRVCGELLHNGHNLSMHAVLALDGTPSFSENISNTFRMLTIFHLCLSTTTIHTNTSTTDTDAAVSVSSGYTVIYVTCPSSALFSSSFAHTKKKKRFYHLSWYISAHLYASTHQAVACRRAVCVRRTRRMYQFRYQTCTFYFFSFLLRKKRNNFCTNECIRTVARRSAPLSTLKQHHIVAGWRAPPLLNVVVPKRCKAN